MKHMYIALLIIPLILISGCTEDKPVKDIYIPGHGDQMYAFANDIRESLLVKTGNSQGIKMLFMTNNKFNVVFDGSNEQDNAYFRVVLINLAKIPTYYAYENRLLFFDYYYYIGNQWYNSTAQNITKPQLNEPVIWFTGPNTGAAETSLKLENNTIYLQGTSYKNLTLAGDKLTLIVFGINRI